METLAEVRQVAEAVSALAQVLEKFPEDVGRKALEQIARHYSGLSLAPDQTDDSEASSDPGLTPSFQVLSDKGFLLAQGKSPSFAEFCSRRVPRTKMDRLAATVYFLQVDRRIVPITLDHILTCFRSQGWPGDADRLLAGLWELSGKRHRLIQTVDNGLNVRLSKRGIEHVMELPREKDRDLL